MQEPLLSISLSHKKFRSLPDVLHTHYGWRVAYPTSLLMALPIFTTLLWFYYVMHSAPILQILRLEDSIWWVFTKIWGCFLICWLLCKLSYRWIFRNKMSIISFAWVRRWVRRFLPIFGLFVLLIAVLAWVENEVLHFVSLSIFIFVMFWPFLRIIGLFLRENVVCGWQAVKREPHFEMQLVDPIVPKI